MRVSAALDGRHESDLGVGRDGVGAGSELEIDGDEEGIVPGGEGGPAREGDVDELLDGGLVREVELVGALAGEVGELAEAEETGGHGVVGAAMASGLRTPM